MACVLTLHGVSVLADISFLSRIPVRNKAEIQKHAIFYITRHVKLPCVRMLPVVSGVPVVGFRRF